MLLTFFLLLLQQAEPSPAATMTAATAFEKFVVPVIAAIGAALIAYVFARRKNDSEINKNDSETVKNYLATISALQKDLDSWIKQVSDLRVAAQKIEDDNRELKNLRRADNDRFFDALVAMQKVAIAIESRAADNAEYKPFRRDAIRLVEMLAYQKNQLSKAKV